MHIITIVIPIKKSVVYCLKAHHTSSSLAHMTLAGLLLRRPTPGLKTFRRASSLTSWPTPVRVLLRLPLLCQCRDYGDRTPRLDTGLSVVWARAEANVSVDNFEFEVSLGVLEVEVQGASHTCVSGVGNMHNGALRNSKCLCAANSKSTPR